jgi:ABC-type sugar transport system ATPase subunit
MVGRSVSRQRVNRTSAPGAVNLQVAALTRRGFFRDVSFSLRRGEVLGLAGLAGAGRSEIARSLCAIDGFDERSITLDGRLFAPRNLRQAMGAGMVYLSEDRKSEGLAPNLSLLANFVAPLNALPGRAGRGAAAGTLFGRLAAQLQLTPADPLRRVRELSGGNQQKLLLAKWMATEPTVLLLDAPTRGVDIGAKEIIHQAIGQLADAGKSILLITSDLPEMVTLCDRVAVLRKGRIIGELSGDAITEERILLAMNGELPDREAQHGT